MRSLACMVLAAILVAPAAQAQSAAAPAAAPAAKKIHHTIPQPPRIRESPLKPSPGQEVPANPQAFTWKVTNKINGKAVSPTDVPVYQIDQFGKGGRIGTVSDGTPVTLDVFRQMNGAILYEIPYQQSPTGKAWIEGRFIAADGPAAPAK